jgi:hypothetical protein
MGRPTPPPPTSSHKLFKRLIFLKCFPWEGTGLGVGRIDYVKHNYKQQVQYTRGFQCSATQSRRTLASVGMQQGQEVSLGEFAHARHVCLLTCPGTVGEWEGGVNNTC